MIVLACRFKQRNRRVELFVVFVLCFLQLLHNSRITSDISNRKSNEVTSNALFVGLLSATKMELA